MSSARKLTRLSPNFNKDRVMSRLEELIQRYCPDGVEYVKLGDILGVNRGRRLTKNQLSADGRYFVYHGSKDTPLGKYSQYNVKGNTTIVVNTGGIGGVKFCDDDFWCSDGSFWIGHSPRLNDKFVYYYLSPKENYFASQKRVGGVPTIDRSVVENVEIPVPPMPVQEEIVRILDSFTELQAELQAELQKRKQQYNYYRDNLLSPLNQGNWEEYSLKELCHYSKDRISAEDVNEDNYVSVENLLQNQQGKVRANNVPSNGNCIKYQPFDILIGNIRPYLHKIWFSNCEGGTNGDVLCVRVNDNARQIITPQFLFCILSSQSFFEYDNSFARGAKMPRGDKQKIMEYTFLVPPLAEQNRIVSILDRFDKLTNDLTTGLPAEIEKRQQQYEYYRDRLLTFKRKGA